MLVCLTYYRRSTIIEGNNKQRINNNKTTSVERTTANGGRGAKFILLVPNLRARLFKQKIILARIVAINRRLKPANKV